MDYFYPPASSYPLLHGHDYVTYPSDEYLRTHAPIFIDNHAHTLYPAYAAVDICNNVMFEPCCAPVSIYTVSYSLAGALTAIAEPRQPPPQLSMSSKPPPQLASSELLSLSPHSIRGSPDAASSDKFVHELDIDRSANTSLSPFSLPEMAAQHEEDRSNITTKSSLRQGGSYRRVAGRASRYNVCGDRSDEFSTAAVRSPCPI